MKPISTQRFSTLQICFSLKYYPNIQGLPYWKNGPLRKNTNRRKNIANFYG
jgi:hypothetical protein